LPIEFPAHKIWGQPFAIDAGEFHTFVYAGQCSSTTCP
jgi:hypothetical protein